MTEATEVERELHVEPLTHETAEVPNIGLVPRRIGANLTTPRWSARYVVEVDAGGTVALEALTVEHRPLPGDVGITGKAVREVTPRVLIAAVLARFRDSGSAHGPARSPMPEGVSAEEWRATELKMARKAGLSLAEYDHWKRPRRPSSFDADLTFEEGLDVEQRHRSRGRGKKLNDAHYRWVAEVYRRESTTTKTVAYLVKNSDPPVTESAALRWIAEAFKRGFLDESERRRRGPRPKAAS